MVLQQIPRCRTASRRLHAAARTGYQAVNRSILLKRQSLSNPIHYFLPPLILVRLSDEGRLRSASPGPKALLEEHWISRSCAVREGNLLLRGFSSVLPVSKA